MDRRVVLTWGSSLLVLAGLGWWYGLNRGEPVGVEEAGGETQGWEAAAKDWLAEDLERLGALRVPGTDRAAGLADFREALRAVGRAEAVARVRGLLESGEDFDTGLGFVIGPGG